MHGANHRANGNLIPIEGIRDVMDCRLELEAKCDSIIRGMAYPDSGITQMGNFGTYEMVKQYLIELDMIFLQKHTMQEGFLALCIYGDIAMSSIVMTIGSIWKTFASKPYIPYRLL